MTNQHRERLEAENRAYLETVTDPQRLRDALYYMGRMVGGEEEKPWIFDPEKPWDGTDSGFVRWCVENAPPDGVTPVDETSVFYRMGQAMGEQLAEMVVEAYKEAR